MWRTGIFTETKFKKILRESLEQIKGSSFFLTQADFDEMSTKTSAGLIWPTIVPLKYKYLKSSKNWRSDIGEFSR
jgi:hypothetical protein